MDCTKQKALCKKAKVRQWLARAAAGVAVAPWYLGAPAAPPRLPSLKIFPHNRARMVPGRTSPQIAGFPTLLLYQGGEEKAMYRGAELYQSGGGVACRTHDDDSALACRSRVRREGGGL